MRSATRAATLLLLLLPLAACPCDLDDTAFDLAGPGAIDCGLVPLGASTADGFACALGALEGDQPFVLRLALRGADSHVVRAWVGRRGPQVWVLLYDGDPGGGGGDDRPHITRWTCADPVRATLTAQDVASTGFGHAVAAGDDIIRCSGGSTFEGPVCE